MIATARLLLRPLAAEDAGFVVALLNDPDFLHGIGDRGVRDEEDALDYIEDASLLAVEERAGGAVIGMCGLLRRDWLSAPDLGYAFLPSGRGRGYAREAAAAVLAGVGGTVLAIVSASNLRSVAVLQALGFAFLGTVEDPDGGTVQLFERRMTGAH